MEMDPPNPQLQSALRSWGRDSVVERHDKLEGMIGDTPFLLGDSPTLADALLVGVARWLDFHDVADKARWPRLARLRARLEADPAVNYASALENGEDPPGTGACVGHVRLEDVIARFGK
jgi:glutathione S-transferase